MIKQKKSLFIAGFLLIFTLGTLFSKTNTSGRLSIKTNLEDSLSEKNLIIILIDALRADHLGCYGYKPDTSPFIDSLARKSIQFNLALSNSSFTRESVSVIFSGCLPSSIGATGWVARPPLSIKSIGQIYKKAGFRTAYLSNSTVCRNHNFTRGFEKISFSENLGFSGNGPRLSGKALEFVDQCRKEKSKFFIYLHFLDPHGPYHPPYNYYSKFKGKSKAVKVRNSKIAMGMTPLYGKVRRNCADLIKEGFGPGEIRFEDLKIRYDAEISLIDDSIKMLLQGLEEKNILNNSIILLTADHGEEFLEHQFVEHAWTLYNESIHIPLLLFIPGLIPPGQIDTPVSSVDILPTLLKLMNVLHSRNDFDGSPMFKFNKDKLSLIFTPSKKPIISELMIQHRSLVRSIIKDNWKYIAAVKWLKPEERPAVLTQFREFEKDKKKHLDIWGPVVHEELYNLSADPGETVNLINNEKEKHMQFRKLLEEYRLHCSKRKKDIKPEGKTKKLSEKERKKLKSLGYI